VDQFQHLNIGLCCAHAPVILNQSHSKPSCLCSQKNHSFASVYNVIYKHDRRGPTLATKEWNTSYNDLLAQLGWPLLSTRRNSRCYSCATAFPAIQLHTSSFSYSPTLTPPDLPLYRPVTRSTAHSASFFYPSVTPLWNNLPLDTVLATSHSAFKSKIN